MYFASRAQAGRMLAGQIAKKYSHEPCAIVALNDGGVVVGAQIAVRLHAVLTLLMSADIDLPQEPAALASITPGGTWAYNQQYTQGEINELASEFRGLVEQEKLTRMHELNAHLGVSSTIKNNLLTDRTVILVADGLETGTLLDLAYEFLKPIKLKRTVVATPLATVPAVDRMHVMADDLFCLSVVGDYMETDHYYDRKDVPDHETVVKVVEQLIQKWQ
jgi:putative phosphoribosyl transferase